MILDSLILFYFNSILAIGPRIPGTSAHKEGRKFIYNEFKKLGFKCEVDSFYEEQAGIKFYNLIFKKGDKPYIMLSTHYDTYPGIEGANDSGSGTIALLVLAHYIKNIDKSFYIVFFDGEDYGEKAPLYGSKHLVKILKPEDFKYGIMIDMIGDRNLEIYIEGFSLKYASHITKRIFEFAKRKRISFMFNKVKYFLIHDHIPLNEKGIKTCLLIDFDYPYWHKEDTFDKISINSIKKITRFLLDFLKEKN